MDTLRPSRSYLVFGIQRSGSTLLCEALKACGLGGRPEEWFYNEWMGGYTKFAGLPPPIGPNPSPVERQESFENILRRGTVAGYFGAKIMWNYWPTLSRMLREIPALDIKNDIRLLEAAFPQVRFLRISRRNRIAQAVSWAKGEQSGKFSSKQSGKPAPNLRYDFDHINRHFTHINEAEKGWDAFFQRHGISPHHVYYEDLIADYEETFREVLHAVDIPMSHKLTVEQPLQRQADHVNQEWAARFEHDLEHRLPADNASLRRGR